MSLLGVILASLIIILYLIYYISRRKFDYWAKRKVPHLKPLPIFGNFKDYILHRRYFPEITRDICEQFPDEPYVGCFFGTEPALIVKDPEYIKLVTTKDFYYFNSRAVAKYTDKEITTQNLFFTYGDRWRLIRQNMTPLFTSVKMKNMFPLIAKCATALDSWLTEEINESSTINTRNIMGSYTMDCIGSCFFGVDTNTMSRSSGINPFKIMGDKIFEATLISGLKQVWRPVWPAIFYGLRFKFVEEAVTVFFHKLLTDVFASRNYKPSKRNDFIDLILSLKKEKYVTGDSITNMKTGENKKTVLEVDDEFLVSNCIVLFAAGYETSSTSLSYALYELAKNEEAQAKAIKDVDNYWIRYNEISYECISEAMYLDACIDETLRLYPVLGVITREVMEEYTLPSGVQLDKGVRVHIPVYYLHHNPDYFPDPEEFKPERFYGETRQEIIPYTYIPFGEGPRICIGLRFAKMQMLAGLLTILKKYRVELAEGMPRSLRFEPKSMTAQPKGKIWLKFIPRK
ncbi:cytochrome P450 6B7-like [Epargyreus clarus]|uniref:cytochrome P450 6B7-like n=1 Tax=Epargyreus clarus TaxID=520877 RepID=UPI003C2AC79C